MCLGENAEQETMDSQQNQNFYSAFPISLNRKSRFQQSSPSLNLWHMRAINSQCQLRMTLCACFANAYLGAHKRV